VPIYQWALPEDLEPLRQACRSLADGGVDVVLLTTATQVNHLLQVAGQMGLDSRCEPALPGDGGVDRADDFGNAPAEGIAIDMEPSHPKMGFLVREAAEHAPALLAAKRASSRGQA
jgi:uroporphyrinogen-III synthase